MAQQLVVEVDGDSSLLHSEHLHGILHPIEGCGLPDKVHSEVGGDVMRHTHVVLQLQSNLLNDTG